MTMGRVLVLLLLLACSVPKLAAAHEVGLSRGTYTISGNEVTAELWFSSSEVSVELAEQLAQRLHVHDCAPAAHRVTLADDRRSVSLLGSFRCPVNALNVGLSIDIFDDLPRGHRHLARSQAVDGWREVLLFDAQRSTELVANGVSRVSVAGGFLRLGFEHILTGCDHLLFLLGLVLVRARLSGLVKVISAFTLAHSLTLACAALQLWAPPARLVEPAIALSIAFVGWQNLRTSQPSHRSWVTFGFGLVHGFGFAGALLEMKLPPERVPTALVSFNLGVELGQLLVASSLWLLLGALRRQPRPVVARSAELLLNGGLLTAGLVWLVVRVRAGYLT
jgi:hydrogenase/urease accessory protein HupE